MTESWEGFFDNHALYYMRTAFTSNTKPEADFIIEDLNLPPKSCILDVGCGTGRHSIELAKRGSQVGEAGFQTERARGTTAGEWGRREIGLDEIEFMILAKKKALTSRRRGRDKR